MNGWIRNQSASWTRWASISNCFHIFLKRSTSRRRLIKNIQRSQIILRVLNSNKRNKCRAANILGNWRWRWSVFLIWFALWSKDLSSNSLIKTNTRFFLRLNQRMIQYINDFYQLFKYICNIKSLFNSKNKNRQ